MWSKTLSLIKERTYRFCHTTFWSDFCNSFYQLATRIIDSAGLAPSLILKTATLAPYQNQDRLSHCLSRFCLSVERPRKDMSRECYRTLIIVIIPEDMHMNWKNRLCLEQFPPLINWIWTAHTSQAQTIIVATRYLGLCAHILCKQWIAWR